MRSWLRVASCAAAVATLGACSLDDAPLAPPDGAAAGCVPSSPPDEVCNGIDDDCDGAIDEGLTRTCGATIGACVAGVQTCTAGAWGACEGERAPSIEVCDGAIDEDCDGSVDEGCACTPAESRPCGLEMGACTPGTQTCGDDGTWGECLGATGPTAEECNGVDDDCDGAVDEELTMPCGSDVGACRPGVRACVEGAWSECVGGVAPATEVCDGAIDEDCDGMVDEGCACTDGATRACGTSVGECTAGTETCAGGSWGSCVGATGPTVEVCDAARADEDCDGTSNEGCACDQGDTQACTISATCAGTRTCDLAGAFGPCISTSPGAPETCNGLDDDCDGVIDEAPADCPGAIDMECTVVRSAGSVYLLCTDTSTWNEAREACAGVGYHLVTVNDAAENTFLQTAALARSAGEWWLGLRDRDGDGEYENDEWVSGTSSYRNWASSPSANRCAALDTGRAGRWEDHGCGGDRRFICEAP